MIGEVLAVAVVVVAAVVWARATCKAETAGMARNYCTVDDAVELGECGHSVFMTGCECLL